MNDTHVLTRLAKLDEFASLVVRFPKALLEFVSIYVEYVASMESMPDPLLVIFNAINHQERWSLEEKDETKAQFQAIAEVIMQSHEDYLKLPADRRESYSELTESEKTAFQEELQSRTLKYINNRRKSSDGIQ